MNAFQAKLASAIQLRESGKNEGARGLLVELDNEFPNDPQVHYQCAWIHDLLGLERKAIPLYEKAIQTGLTGDDLKSGLLSLGNTTLLIRFNTYWRYSPILKNLMFFLQWLITISASMQRRWNCC